jgi:hypothetical protein
VGDVIEGVVIVVEDDYEPIPAQSSLGAGRARALDGRRGHPAEDKGFIRSQRENRGARSGSEPEL